MGTLTDVQDIAVTVTNVNEAPVISSNGAGATASISVAENQTAVTTVTSTDVDASATATYSISGGADAAKFAINATTGVLTFVSAPNYEIAADSGANNVYDVTVQVSDGTSTDTQAIAVTVTNTNETPTDLLYRPNVPSANLVADFEFGAVAATTLDDSGNGHNLTMSGTLSTTTGPTGSVALDLTGGASGNYGNIAGITTGGAMTVSTTVRFDSTGNWERIYDFGQASSGGIGNMYLSRFGASNDLTFSIEKSGVYTYRATAPNAITNGTWMNVATTVDASGNMKLYINGALAATATGVALTTGVRDFNDIGRSNWEANGDGRFDGAVDSFVANVAMSAADIAALSNQTTGFTVAENSANGTSLGNCCPLRPGCNRYQDV